MRLFKSSSSELLVSTSIETSCSTVPGTLWSPELLLAGLVEFPEDIVVVEMLEAEYG